MVKKQFHLGNPIDPKVLDRRVTQAHSHEALLGLQWSEVERTRRKTITETSLLTDVVDTDEGHSRPMKIVDHALELQETVSLLPGSKYATPTPPHYLPLGMTRNTTEQLKIGRSQTIAAGKDRTIHSFLENISHPTPAWVFVELLTFEE